MFKRKRTSETIHTLIGPHTRIHGDVEFAGGLHVDGYIKGDVCACGPATSFLSVSAQGRIEGSVTARDVVLHGVVTGDIQAGGRVQLGSTARVHGNVRYAVIESAVGAQINGKLVHRAEPAGGPRPATDDIDQPGGDAPVLIGHQRAG
jgi:cytoskeletal protein CcmA (bactofilin family)